MDGAPRREVTAQVPPHIAVAADTVTKDDRSESMLPLGRFVEQRGAVARSERVPPAIAQEISFVSSSPGNSFTEGYFMISLREIFQAFWTIQDSERSWRVASS
jgi:hypothetical protein